MGGGRKPGIPGGDGRPSRDSEDQDDLDQYGIGQKDPVTGVYPFYDVPSYLERAQVGTPVNWSAIFAQWGLLVADFQDVYGIALMREFDRMTWVEFRLYVQGLMSSAIYLLVGQQRVMVGGSRIARYFAPSEPDPDDDEGG